MNIYICVLHEYEYIHMCSAGTKVNIISLYSCYSYHSPSTGIYVWHIYTHKFICIYWYIYTCIQTYKHTRVLQEHTSILSVPQVRSCVVTGICYPEHQVRFQFVFHFFVVLSGHWFCPQKYVLWSHLWCVNYACAQAPNMECLCEQIEFLCFESIFTYQLSKEP